MQIDGGGGGQKGGKAGRDLEESERKVALRCYSPLNEVVSFRERAMEVRIVIQLKLIDANDVNYGICGEIPQSHY